MNENKAKELRVPVLIQRSLYNSMKRHASKKKAPSVTKLINEVLQQWIDKEKESERAKLHAYSGA